MEQRYDFVADELIEINARAILPFRVTKEHPLLISCVKKNSNYYSFSKGNRNKKTISNIIWTKWVESGDVESLLEQMDYKTEYYLHLPIITPESDITELEIDPSNARIYKQTKIPLNIDTAWAIGLYVAEGFGKESVNWSLNINEKNISNKLEKIFTQLGYSVKTRETQENNGLVVTIHSRTLSKVLRLLCGSGAYKKHIPHDILYHNKEEILASFLKGYIDGDAFQRKKTLYLEGNTRSIRLAHEIQLATARFGSPSTLITSKSKDNNYKGKTIKGTTRFNFSITDFNIIKKIGYECSEEKEERCFYIKHNNSYLMKIISSKKFKEKTNVINFTTSDGTFLISNIITHNCGRKFGKTELAQNEVMDYAGTPESMIWWVSPFYSVSDIAWTRLNNNLNPAIIKRRSQRDRTITLINDSTVGFKSADNEKALVGEGLDFCVLEEAAYIKESVWLETVRPNLGDSRRRGDMMGITTPSGLNWVYREWRKGLDNHFLDYESWSYKFDVMPILNEKIDSYDGGFPSWVNPYWSKEELQSVIHTPRSIFLQEYGSRFIEDLSNVFRGVGAVVSDDIGLPSSRDPNMKYYAGFDVARSGAGDNAVITIVDNDFMVVFELVMRGQSLPVQVQTVKDVCTYWNECPVLVDTTNPMGDSVYEFVEDTYRNAEPYHYTNPNKIDLMNNLSILIQTKQVMIPNKGEELNDLISELRIFGAGRTKSGAIKYEAPEGFHDDHVNSMALACWLANTRKSQGKTWAKFMTI